MGLMNWRIGLISVVVAAVIGLNACSPAQNQQPVVYQCGAQEVRADFAGKQLTLRINDEQYTFMVEPTPNGQRFYNPDHNAQFWTQNNEAQLVIGEQVFPLCLQDETLPQQLSARGNEPFWLLQRKGAQAALRRPTGDRDFTEVTTSFSESTQLWTVQLDENSALTVQAETCVDSMSGMPYPYHASLTHDGKQLDGCAGEPRQLIAGVTWQLQEISTQQPTITFMNDGKVTGFAGCNRFFGHYQLTGEGLRLGRMAATKMMCSAPEMAVEDAYLQQLTQVSRFTIENGQLVLHYDGGQLIFN